MKLMKTDNISLLWSTPFFGAEKCQDEISTFTVLKTSLAPSFTFLNFSLIYSCQIFYLNNENIVLNLWIVDNAPVQSGVAEAKVLCHLNQIQMYISNSRPKQSNFSKTENFPQFLCFGIMMIILLSKQEMQKKQINFFIFTDIKNHTTQTDL